MSIFVKLPQNNESPKITEAELKKAAKGLGIISEEELLSKVSLKTKPPSYHSNRFLPEFEDAIPLNEEYLAKIDEYDRNAADKEFFNKCLKKSTAAPSIPPKGQRNGYNMLKYFESREWEFGIIYDLPCFYNFQNGTWYPLNSETGRHRFFRLLTEEDKAWFENDMLDKLTEAVMSNSKIFNVSASSEDCFMINFLDSVYDIRDGKVYPHSSSYLFLYCLNAKTTDIESSDLDGTLLSTYLANSFGNDKTKMDTLGEIIGASISKIRNQKQTFILYGKTSSGKSVALNAISRLICEDFVSALSLTQLGGKFEMSELTGAWVNTSSEIPAMKGVKADMFKRITGNDPIHAERKGKTGFKTRIHALMLFAVNSIPTVREPDDAYYARLRVLEFDHTVPKEDWICDIENRLIDEELGYVLRYAIEGLKRYIANGFEISGKSESDSIVYEAKTSVNSFALFAADNLEPCSEDNFIHNKDLFARYKEFCTVNHLDEERNNVCSRFLAANYNSQRIRNGKERDRGYSGIRFK